MAKNLLGEMGMLNREGTFQNSSKDWAVEELANDLRLPQGWQSSRITLRARANAAAGDLICSRLPIKSLQEMLGAQRLSMLVNSVTSIMGTAGVTRVPQEGGPLPGEPKPASSWWTVLGGADAYIFIGFLTPVHHRTFIRENGGFIEAGCHTDRPLTPGEEFEGDTLVWKIADSPYALLEEFGDLCSKREPGRTSQSRPAAWNSWDYYFTLFTERHLDEQLKILQSANRRLPQPVEQVVLDMGWSTSWGDWFENGRFPSGMKGVADKIKAAGFTPGVWLCPYLGQDTIYYGRPQICVRDKEGITRIGSIGGLSCIRIDPTNPEGEQFLRDTFTSLKEAGFAYFKLDFLHYLVTVPGEHRFYKNNMGRIDIVRHGLKIIREAIGEDSILLACGCQPEACIGIADYCRIGGDTSTYVSTTKILTQFLAGRYWMNNRLFTSDPDFLIVRGDATAFDPEYHHNPYHEPESDPTKSRSGAPWSTLGEPRLWATLVGMSGGIVTLSDHVGKLNAAGMDMVARTMQNCTTEAARPLDLMESIYPHIWLREGERPALAVLNLSGEPQEFELPAARFPELAQFIGCKDIWGHEDIIKKDGKLTVSLPPYDAAWFVK
ncbi:MAG: alpha-galactosidase [Armatimonadota bacterium]